MKGASKKIRDSVHKDIFLDTDELRVLDTPQLQRLRGIRQLGTAFFVYPGAHHTRFEHCLGACWMAKKIVAALEQSGNRRIPETEKKAVFLAALAHDVTHIPFGHTFEDDRKLLPRHDEDGERFRCFFNGSPLGELLNSSEAGRIAVDILNPAGDLPREKLFLKQIVDGTICADLLDYLKRDNYHCGLAQFYDDRLFHYFNIHDGRLTLMLHQNGIFRRDALSEVTHLLRIRYVLSERVYYHHAKIASGAMISKAIERALRLGMAESELYNLQDDVLPYYLNNTYGNTDVQLRELIECLTARRLYKRCYMLSRNIGEANVASLEERFHHGGGGEREALEGRIAELAGAGEHEIAVYCPSGKMALKEAEMPALCGPDRIRRFCDLNSAEIQVLQQQHRALWKFFVFVAPSLSGRRKRVADACEEVLGLSNELPG